MLVSQRVYTVAWYKSHIYKVLLAVAWSLPHRIVTPEKLHLVEKSQRLQGHMILMQWPNYCFLDVFSPICIHL